MMMTRTARKPTLNCAADQSGASALEFAIIVPVFLMTVLAAIDLALVSYRLTQAQAAARLAARIAVVSPIIATRMAEFDSRDYAPGAAIPVEDIPSEVCSGSPGGAFQCSGGPADAATANLVLGRVRQLLPDADPSNLQVTYTYTGLGAVGNPVGMDFEPVVTVDIINLNYVPLSSFLFGSPIVDLPIRSVTLTGEDLS